MIKEIMIHEGIKFPARQRGKGIKDKIIGTECLACGKEFKAGDQTALVLLGPGDDPAMQKMARVSLPYYAKTLELHLACATGF